MPIYVALLRGANAGRKHPHDGPAARSVLRDEVLIGYPRVFSRVCPISCCVFSVLFRTTGTLAALSVCGLTFPPTYMSGTTDPSEPARIEDRPQDIGHPRGTLAIVIVFGALFVFGWFAMYLLLFLQRGAPHS